MTDRNTTRSPLLEISDLSLSYHRQGRKTTRGQVAIDRVSLNLEAGSILGLIGASGAGKSSIARAILQLTRPDTGKILFDGKDMSTMTGAQLMKTRQRIQIVFQEPSASLSPRRTIAQTLLEPLQHFAIGDRHYQQQKIIQSLHTVGLDKEALQRYPHQFSSGQQQRIAIARALVTDPDLLIADEAVSSLDVSVQAQILQLMLSLQKAQDIAILFISHDLGVIRQIADQVAVMYQGQLMEYSSADTFFSQAAHPYSKALLSFARLEQPGDLPRERWQLQHGRESAGNEPACLYAGNCEEKMPMCEADSPGTHEIGNEHSTHCVRCHLYDGTDTYEK